MDKMKMIMILTEYFNNCFTKEEIDYMSEDLRCLVHAIAAIRYSEIYAGNRRKENGYNTI